ILPKEQLRPHGRVSTNISTRLRSLPAGELCSGCAPMLEALASARCEPMADIPFDFAPLAPDDLAAIDRLDARAFGPGRFAKSAYRLREGVEPDWNLSFVARIGTLVVGANRITPILCVGEPALLLGPLPLEPAFRS